MASSQNLDAWDEFCWAHGGREPAKRAWGVLWPGIFSLCAWCYVWGRSGGCGVLTPSWAQHPLPPGSEPAGPQLHVPVHVAECAPSQCCADFQTSGSGICRLPLPSCWALLRERSLCHCRRQNLTDCCRVPAPSLQCLLKLLIPRASASSLLPSVVSAVVPSWEKRAEPCPAPCWKAAEPRGCTRAAG